MVYGDSGFSGRDLEIVRVDKLTLASSIELFEAILGEKFGDDQTIPRHLCALGASDYPSKLKFADLARLRVEYRISDSVGLILPGQMSERATQGRGTWR